MKKCYLSEESRQKGLEKCREIARKKTEQRKKNYENDPKLCSRCKKPLSYKQRYNKYCGHSCSAKVSNLGVIRNGSGSGLYTKKPCEYCEKITKNIKYCSNECCVKHKWDKTKKKIEDSGIIPVGKSNNPNVAKKYLKETREHKCEICGETEWMGQLFSQ